MKYKNLKIIGTSHIAKESLEEVKKAIEDDNPDIVALELDKRRLYALMHNQKSKVKLRDILKIGFKGYFFSLIGAWAEKKLGDIVGVPPGSEMKQAVKLAKKQKAKIALIDQDIEITLKRFSQTLTWREKWNFVIDIIKAVIFRKKEIDFDLTTVPSKKIIKKLMDKVKKRYPNIYKALVVERNEIMADRLIRIMKEKPDNKILAIIGAGHEEDIFKIIKEKINKVDITYSFSVG